MGLLILVVLINGCSNHKPMSNECQQKMTGYLDITEDKQYIIPKTEHTRYILNEAAIPDTIKNGEEITVTYTNILESYPPELTACEIESR
ncbi:hypothetical protein CHH58_03450 [Terribacillus saccharophilus]|uniref:hypothetical protein n=1 Tax=Terribacillus saccharophilus TaxID=361277 RepID=UPI000BA7CEA8|nr:hypothetical protein [Terribacillus saccharophilus]PAF17542.1 hypothetical protein CHH51_12900 [Terribacillus saccharophilus]PAF38501.1 hypothetical protein CHH58_03450 [Terribacillus saccharophilus]